MAHSRVRVGAGVVLALVGTLLVPGRSAAVAQAGAVPTPCVPACTHGPDLPPPGVDIKTSRPPLPANRGEGTAPAPATPVCTGDGTSGARVQLVYARPTGAPDRYDAYAASFQTWAAQIDAGVKESAEQTGGLRRIRFVHDASCTPTISRLVLTTAAVADWGAFTTQVRQAHGDPPFRRFLVWMDANELCGVGEFGADDRPDWANMHQAGVTGGPGRRRLLGHPRCPGRGPRAVPHPRRGASQRPALDG